MKLNVGIFFGGFFGALGILLFLVAFGTDYWLLATEGGKCTRGPDDIGEEKITFHHEGFFWRCWFSDVGENTTNIWKFWYTNQPPSKNCTHAYLSPFPRIRDEYNSTSYDSAIIYRGFWTVLMLLGVVTVLMAGFFIICAAPYASHILYKTGGGFFITAGMTNILKETDKLMMKMCEYRNMEEQITLQFPRKMEDIKALGFISIEARVAENWNVLYDGHPASILWVNFLGIIFSLVVVMYVIWVQAMADLENYENMKKKDCPDFTVHVRYGWSFILAPIGIFFALFAGMLFLLVGRTIYLHSD